MKHEVKIDLIRNFKQAAIMFAIALVVVGCSELLVAPWGDALEVEMLSQRDISVEIESMEQTVIHLEGSLASSGKTFSNLWQIRADYIADLGDMAKDHDLIIGQLTSDSIFPISGTNAVMALPITISVQGDMGDISDFIWDLTQSETLVAVEKASYRTGTTEDFSWMYRSIDENVLLPWWEISSYVDAYALQQAGLEEVEIEAPYQLTVEDLMQSNGDPVCYLELNVIGVGG